MSDYIVKFDPLNEFQDVPIISLVDAVGILRDWAMEAIRTDADIESTMKSLYGYPTDNMQGGMVDMDGYFVYPEDPALSPLISIHTEDQTVLFYQYAIVAIVDADNENQSIFRMD